MRLIIYLHILGFLFIAHNNIFGNSGNVKSYMNNETGDSIVNTPKTTITSGNPIIRHIRCADPAAEVWNDGKVWIYSSHDEDDATEYSTIDGYHVFSSGDLVNWTDHGEILNSDGVSWGNPNGGFMFAPDAAYKDGIYYLYFPHLSNEWKWRIGVATSTKPEGPFTDIGHYIEGTDNIDPVCFMDDDGQAYLIWGGGSENPKIARLKENMTELAEEPRIIEYGADNFGEGPYMHKRNGVYYFSYTCKSCYPYQGFYSMGDNPYGPFEYKGELNPNPPGAQDHHSIIEYHNQWYYFYHVGNYGADGSLYRRNICVDSLFYNEDGTMREIVQTKTGVGLDLIGSAPGLIVPGRIEAEKFFRQEGIEKIKIGGDTTVVSQIHDGDWFDFVLDILGSETYTATFQISEAVVGAEIFLAVDDRLIDTIKIETGTDSINTPIYLNQGKHTLKFLFNHSDTSINLMNMDWIELYGDIEYFRIDVSATEGGTIQPEGISYYERGDSAVFKIETNFNFILNTLVVDSTSQDLSNSYVFYNVTENHIIQANFSECQNVASTPFYQVNDDAIETGTEISVTEADYLKLFIECDGFCDLSWTYPNGEEHSVYELIIDSIGIDQKGTYTAKIINDQGCVTKYPYNVFVQYFDLDVFEAESFFDQSGVGILPCYDIGGGSLITSIENNDYCYYRVKVDSSGFYNLIARVEATQNGGYIEVSYLDSIIASIPVKNDLYDEEQNWYTTEAVEIGLEEGYHRLKFTFKVEGDNLFYFNWFDLTYIRPFVHDTTTNIEITLNSFPNPFIYNTQIMFSIKEVSFVDLSIFNCNGEKIKSLISYQRLNPGTYIETWNTMDNDRTQLRKGVYFIRFLCGETAIIKKVVLL